MPDRARSRTQSTLHDATLCKNYWQSHMLQQHTRLTCRFHQGYIKVSHWHVGMHAWTEEAFKVSVQRWQNKVPLPLGFSSVAVAFSYTACHINWGRTIRQYGLVWVMHGSPCWRYRIEDRNISQLLDHEFVLLNLKCPKDNKHGNYKVPHWFIMHVHEFII